jgi:Mg-chelatase subunit ChlD
MRSLLHRAQVSAALLVVTATLATSWGCGARTALSTPAPAASNAFCARETYASGFGGLSIYLLLDQSLSMADDMKWDSTTAAIAAFVEDPLAAGIGMGMQYFPLNDECNDVAYATPATPIQLLPSNAAAIQASLAAHSPDGGTPTLPALRGAIEYARGSLIGDPTRQVIVVLATDGEPDDCSSTVSAVAEAAADGLSGQPQVLTAVIGIQNAEASALAEIAASGGAGAPIPIGSGPSAAQQFVDALRSIRDSQESCRFVIPPTPGATPAPTDVQVSYLSAPGAAAKALPLLAGASSCSSEGGFYVDDPTQPTAVTLCPGNCALAHMSGGSTISVTAGCGEGSPPPGMSPPGGPDCGSSVDFTCVTACAATGPAVVPVCVGTEWACAPGLISTTMCYTCAAVPHGCCKSDGTLAEASCINGAWECPPGGQLFGTADCKPPAVCAATLPCPLTQYCEVPDASCGLGSVAGTCKDLPVTCPGGGPPACGCDGQVYANGCAAASAGVDVAANGTCATPAGDFACGPIFCRVADQICQKVDDFSQAVAPDSYTCIAAPPACPTGCGCHLCPTCPAGKTCSEVCGQDSATGAPELTCNQI